MSKFKVGDKIKHRNGHVYLVSLAPDSLSIRIGGDTWSPGYLYKAIDGPEGNYVQSQYVVEDGRFTLDDSHQLKPCPFCGNSESLTIIDAKEIKTCPYPFGYLACCSAKSNISEEVRGCGAHTGWCNSEKEAVEKWNRRVE